MGALQSLQIKRVFPQHKSISAIHNTINCGTHKPESVPQPRCGEHSRECLPCFAFGIMVQAGAQEYGHSPACSASGKLPQLQAECPSQARNVPTCKAVYSTCPEKQLRHDPLEHGIKLPGQQSAKGIFLCYLQGDKWFHESGEHHLQTNFTGEVQGSTFRQMF